jgi:hypothetical protein
MIRKKEQRVEKKNGVRWRGGAAVTPVFPKKTK